jgi:hypothetical protein
VLSGDEQEQSTLSAILLVLMRCGMLPASDTHHHVDPSPARRENRTDDDDESWAQCRPNMWRSHRRV